MLTVSLLACMQIAAIFEFGGAMLLGRVVTSTIAGKCLHAAVHAHCHSVGSGIGCSPGLASRVHLQGPAHRLWQRA